MVTVFYFVSDMMHASPEITHKILGWHRQVLEGIHKRGGVIGSKYLGWRQLVITDIRIACYVGRGILISNIVGTSEVVIGHCQEFQYGIFAFTGQNSGCHMIDPVKQSSHHHTA